MLKHLDLFSGIGGFALAAYVVGGIETKQFVEINPYCQKVLAKNFPGVPIHGDITTYTCEPGRFDIITGGFPAKIYRSPIPTGEGWKVNGLDSSLNSCESFANADPVTLYWKTSQKCLGSKEGALWEQFCGSFPKAGMMRNGRLFQRHQWERRTYEKESSLLLPTVTASDATVGGVIGENDRFIQTKSGTYRRHLQTGNNCSVSLGRLVKLMPTPTAQDAKNSTLPRSLRSRDTIPGALLREGHTGELNPEFCEWLMGYPIGWTELPDAETPSSPSVEL